MVSSSWDFTEDFDFTQSKWGDAVDVGWRPQELKVIVLGLLSGGFTFKYSSTADHNCGVGVWWGELESGTSFVVVVETLMHDVSKT